MLGKLRPCMHSRLHFVLCAHVHRECAPAYPCPHPIHAAHSGRSS